MATYGKYIAGELEDYAWPEEALKTSIVKSPYLFAFCWFSFVILAVKWSYVRVSAIADISH